VADRQRSLIVVKSLDVDMQSRDIDWRFSIKAPTRSIVAKLG
jgi:hypothetical protein